MKLVKKLLIIVFLFCLQPVWSQYNPYLRKKAKNKPSAIMARQNKKEAKKQNRRAKKQMRKSRKRVNR